MEDNSTLADHLSSATITINNLTNAVTEAVNLSIAGVTEIYNNNAETISIHTTESSPVKVNVQPITKETTTSKHFTTTLKTTTINPYADFGPPDGIEYIFVPLGVMIFVIILSAVVFIISRKRKMERLRHRLMPLYNFDPSEEGEDDWETELLDEGFNSRQRRVSNQFYRSMDRADNVELFSGQKCYAKI